MVTPKWSLGVHGASGRMGVRLIHLIAEDPEAKLTCAIERPDVHDFGFRQDLCPVLFGQI